MPIKIGGTTMVQVYTKTGTNNPVEMLIVKDQNDNLIHKRTKYTFYNNGVVYQTQTKTWEVENVTAPSSPTQTGYNFNGWYSASSGGTKYTFPFLAGNVDTNIYSQYSLKTYTYYTGTLPTGVASITARLNSPSGTTVNNGGSITHFDTLYITATASTGYNNPNIISGMPLAITGTITGADHVTSGGLKVYQVKFVTDWNGSTISTQNISHGSNATWPSVSYGTGYELYTYTGTYTNITSARTITIYRQVRSFTLTKGSIPTGVATFTVNRTSSPLQGAATGNLNNSATIYYNDVLSISATATGGYNNPTVSPSSSVTVTAAVSATVTSGGYKSYSLWHYPFYIEFGDYSDFANKNTYTMNTNSTLGTLAETGTYQTYIPNGYTLQGYQCHKATGLDNNWTVGTIYPAAWNVKTEGKYGNVEFIPKYQTINYTLTAQKNGGTGGNNSGTYNIESTTSIQDILGTPTYSGYGLTGWKWTSTSAGGWTNGTTYVPTTKVTNKYASGNLQAQWEILTTTPTIGTINVSGPVGKNYSFSWTVKNKDTTTVTLYSNLETTNPTTSKTGIAYNGIGSFTQTHLAAGGTVYARAKSASKGLSNYASRYGGGGI